MFTVADYNLSPTGNHRARCVKSVRSHFLPLARVKKESQFLPILADFHLHCSHGRVLRAAKIKKGGYREHTSPFYFGKDGTSTSGMDITSFISTGMVYQTKTRHS